MDSPRVIDDLLSPPDDGAQRIFLLGNHEAMLLNFLDSPRGAVAWLRNGGDSTLHTYGVDMPRNITEATDPAILETARRDLLDKLPPAHLTFYQNLQLCHEVGDYYFVHAGIRPGVALNMQTKQDMIWIRNEFLQTQEDFGKIIVHGHSIRTEVEERPNRIGIDTGAYMSGTLTALVLEGNERRYLST
jgi:serine/threonine protein phosphatase 1